MDILLDDMQDAEKALAFLKTWRITDLTRILRAKGRILLELAQEETIDFLVEICNGKYRPQPLMDPSHDKTLDVTDTVIEPDVQVETLPLDTQAQTRATTFTALANQGLKMLAKAAPIPARPSHNDAGAVVLGQSAPRYRADYHLTTDAFSSPPELSHVSRESTSARIIEEKPAALYVSPMHFLEIFADKPTPMLKFLTETWLVHRSGHAASLSEVSIALVQVTGTESLTQLIEYAARWQLPVEQSVSALPGHVAKVWRKQGKKWTGWLGETDFTPLAESISK